MPACVVFRCPKAAARPWGGFSLRILPPFPFAVAAAGVPRAGRSQCVPEAG